MAAKTGRRAELLADIVETVCPDKARRAACAERAEGDADLVTRVSKDMADVPSPGRARADAKKFRDYLRKALSALRGNPSDVQLAVGGPGGIDAVQAAARAATTFIDGVHVKPAQKPWDPVKYVAMLRAWNLMADFGSSARGAKDRQHRVAQLFYEVATGVEEANLTQYRIHIDRNLDRVDPAIVVRLPFSD